MALDLASPPISCCPRWTAWPWPAVPAPSVGTPPSTGRSPCPPPQLRPHRSRGPAGQPSCPGFPLTGPRCPWTAPTSTWIAIHPASPAMPPLSKALDTGPWPSPSAFCPYHFRNSRRLLFAVAGVVGPDLRHRDLPPLQLIPHPLLHAAALSGTAPTALDTLSRCRVVLGSAMHFA